MAFMWIACWQNFGTSSAQEEVVPGALLSTDVDEIIVPKAGEDLPQTYFPTGVFQLDMGPQMQSPVAEWGLDLTRGEEETAERHRGALELLF